MERDVAKRQGEAKTRLMYCSLKLNAMKNKRGEGPQRQQMQSDANRPPKTEDSFRNTAGQFNNILNLKQYE